MSADTATPTGEARSTVETVTPGDEVELAVDDYEWTNALDVVHTDDPVEWEVPFGEAWWTRTIFVEGGLGAEYAIRYDSGGDTHLPEVTCYRSEDSNLGDKRGDVVHLDLYEEDDSEEEQDADDDSAPNLEDEYDVVEVEEHDVGDELPDDIDDEQSDEEEPTDDSEEDTPAVGVVPEGLTKEEIRDAVSPGRKIGAVAEEIGLETGRTRALLVNLGLYSQVRENGPSKRGDEA